MIRPKYLILCDPALAINDHMMGDARNVEGSAQHTVLWNRQEDMVTFQVKFVYDLLPSVFRRGVGQKKECDFGGVEVLEQFLVRGEFTQAGSTPSRPEIDDNDFADMFL